MEKMLIVVGILAFIFITDIYRRFKRIRELKDAIKEEYGQKPIIKKYDFEKITYFWDEYKKVIPEDERIDDVTWSDLEMNKVFARINSSCSFVGEQILYASLHCMHKNNFNMELLEEKINFYESNDLEREETELILCRLKKEEESYFLPKFMSNLDDYGIGGILGYRIMQILLVALLLISIIFQSTGFLFFAGAVFAINLIIYQKDKIKYELNLNSLSSVVDVVIAGKKIAYNKNLYYESKFQNLKKEVSLFKKILKRVNILKNKKDASLSGDIISIITDYLIGATLVDFTGYHSIIEFLKKRQKEYMKLYEKIGQIDMAITIASFRKSLSLFTVPHFHQEHVLKMEEIYHPLINDPVCNTVTIDKNCIITGSNASGKSTFIKAVAVNVILAHSLHTCMAKKMSLPYAKIITSMAVRDDLMAGESYYIKEIKYLNRIIQSLSKERLVICLIDEILRGTNTEERIAASVSILRFLHKKNCIAIVASHDIELTKILAGICDNYHFREQMQDKDIAFDYKIYNGSSTYKNAIKLLKHIGFPDEIVENANRFDM
ncbi:hypothetical protein RBH29_12315 [Herbivorax sp. ANBcel31]|uniref:MutS-related protein n=1 Tax=Herbivorax sp. ANBcel31 TaxID=3069754 RepID=UPI0027B64E8C|nr:hypothetical protein [Herbivorax sp. ANBcel31]MDQ2087211.1 hypothetical protein [Herbivorax sp. ANBcel31]